MTRRRVLVFSVLTILTALAIGAPQPALAHEEDKDKPWEGRLMSLWGCPMCEDVREYEFGKCPRCRMDLVPMGRVRLKGVEALMPGVPQWLFYATAISLLVLSFILFEIWGRRRMRRDAAPGRRWNLLRLPGVKRLVKQRWFQFSLQLPVFLLFMLVVISGFMGNPAPERNIAPALTWALWWTWLAIVILFMGKIWCTACPWMAIADWMSKLTFWRRVRRPLSLGKRWPRGLRNIWIATILFVLLTWLELGYGVTQKPWLTAALALLMVVASVATMLIFERKAFCRYACLVGRVSGLYSMFAGSELRAVDADKCRECGTKDCYRGNDEAYPCPTHQFIGSMDVNTYCTLCTECIKACPEDNIAFNARPFGADLIECARLRIDEAYLAVIMLSMSAFHGLTMTPSWDKLIHWIHELLPVNELGAFSIGMAAMLALPLVVYYGICALMKWTAGDREHSPKYLFIRFAYSFLPIALFYHLAHNTQHIFYEGKKIIRLASDPFGIDWNLFGTANMSVDAMLPITVGWGIQVALIIIGHIYGIMIAHKTAASIYQDQRQATLSQAPILAGMLLFSFQSLWLVAQPMAMRTAM